jgi:predicted ArsR family transcriptional regulator
VARLVLEDGPVSASAVAELLGLTPAAVRRHLDGLVADGLAEARDPRPTATRGRGRPARVYVLTDAGHASMTTAYDDLATSAMEFLAEQLGPEAVEEFAARRVADLEHRYLPVVEAAGAETDQRAQALADALARDGYAASARPVGAPETAGAEGIQLCQGHCPVQHVATRFPQLCEAETEVFSRLLGVHVQRLATLASGAHVCTTHVPTSGITTLPAPSHRTTPTPMTEARSHEPRTSDERNRS